jgi:hypothetical protein
VQNEGVGFADLLELFQKEIPKLSTLHYALCILHLIHDSFCAGEQKPNAACTGFSPEVPAR